PQEAVGLSLDRTERGPSVLVPSSEGKRVGPEDMGETLKHHPSPDHPSLSTAIESTSAREILNLFPEEQLSKWQIERGLQIPLSWSDESARMTGRGSILGIRRAAGADDLAILATVIAASPFQRRRRRISTSLASFSIHKEDLRSWNRRRPQSNLMVMVADLTSCASAKLAHALAPYIQKAYEERAQICV